MKRVLFAISDSFPYGTAYAARTRALCKLFQFIGFETVILCDYPSESANTNEYGEIVAISDNPYSGVQKLINLPIVYQETLNKLMEKNSYDFVISRSMFDRFDRVLRVVNKHGIPLILESCEWYDIKGFARGRLDVRYWQFKHCFEHSYNYANGVIAISKLLESHYKKRVKNVIRIPGIHEIEKLTYRIDPVNEDEVSLVFAGNIFGGKEQFEGLIIAMSKIARYDKTIILNVYGTSKEAVEHSLSKLGRKALSLIKESVCFHGRISQLEMANICADNDFGVFFRPNRRSSHAGFPTKLGEYLAAGTPVITNKTSDISDVLINGKNGFMLESSNADEILKVLEQCLDLSVSEYRQMRVNARETAEKVLDYNVYSESLTEFLKALAI